MGYLKKTLGENETVIRRARFNWTYDLQSFFWLALGLAPTIAVLAFGGSTERPFSGARLFFLFAAAGGLIAGVLVFANRSVRKWTTVIVLTDARLIFKTGLIARESHDISIQKIEEVNLRQSFLGRLFGYGVLVIGGEGMLLIELPPIDQPVAFLREVESTSIRARNRIIRE